MLMTTRVCYVAMYSNFSYVATYTNYQIILLIAYYIYPSQYSCFVVKLLIFQM